MVIFFGANAAVNTVCGGGIFGDAMTHEDLRDKSKGVRFFTKGFPGVPIDIAFKIGGEERFWAIFGDESNGRATNGTTKSKRSAFEPLFVGGFGELHGKK